MQWIYISSRGTATVTSDTIHLTETFGNAPFVELGNLAYNPENITVDITGDFGNVYLIYDYYTSETEIGTISIKTPGRYELPKSAKINSGFRTNKAAKLGLTIKQIPEYEGAIVTDGVDDYLKLDKVGYKIGTVIIKAIPLTVTESCYVFDVERKRTYFSYLLNTDNTILPGFSFNSKRVYGNYDVLRYNDNNIANIYTPMFIGCRFNIDEYISMALYEIAVYQDVLTEEQVLEEIDKMNPYKLIQDYTFDKSNSDVDRDKVYNKLNPNEYIELKNFEYSLNSGYGLYKENYLTYRTYMHPTDKRANVTCTDSVINITEIYKNNIKFIEKQNEASSDCSVKITGLTDDIDLYYTAYKTTGGISIKLVNGINHLLAGENYTGFITENFTGKCNITIEQIPEYPNHLVFDGVDDIAGPIPNLNAEEGTVIVQLNPIDNNKIKFSPIQEGSLQTWAYGAYLQQNLELTSRNETVESIRAIKGNVENGVYAFAYNSHGIGLFYNNTYLNTTNINKHSKYIFGCNSLTQFGNVSKLALKRVKIFNKKLTENQIKKEYNKLLNE